ncbi:DUF4419 domain-containing protein [Catellatospora coxensis]|uniref:Uncharacterized protein n=1 Tax=Catellatospora coxensis TaxID=310354 RepID=A0A8J3KXX7_9ACTN|nr:DUF4419 domain-containing protein [Catellatospora coxensis]GIG07439.1 hypothetical protein Cco03nite_41390 [Catellatospora coxensis]
MFTFPVDDVTPAAEPLPTRPLRELYPDALAIGGDPELQVLVDNSGSGKTVELNGVHPLLGAIGRAFVDHRPLVLSPDAVWITIAQGVAQHIRLNAEELRSRLVAHSDRKILAVYVDGAMPTDAESWRDVVDQLAKQLEAEASGTDLFECDFSTSTDVERMVGRVIMLDAYSQYFAYWMICICGIPSITLTGTVEDWRRIRARVDAVAGFGLENWCRSLRPILDQFARAASGDVDTAFWQRIYNPADTYGVEVVTGWATRFYPYLDAAGVIDRPNPMLELPIDEPRGRPVAGDDPFATYDGPGIASSGVPATLAKAIINVNDRATGKNQAMALHAGLVGVAQDADGALRPVAGWHLTHTSVPVDVVIDRIVRDHETTPPVPVRFEEATEELVGLYSRVGSASLCGGALRLLPRNEHVEVYGLIGGYLLKVGELADGRSLAAVVSDMIMHWTVCRIEANERTDPRHPAQGRLLDAPADAPVYGTSLAMLLEAAMDSGGDISHLEVGRLSGLIRADG